jgi:hypothetical protein
MAVKYELDEKGEPKLDADGNKIEIKETKPESTKLPEGVDPALIKKLIQEGVDAALAPVKENLDSAYAARDEANKKVAEFEQKERDAEIQRLKDEGKHKEAHEAEISALKATNETLKKTNTNLTRDIDVRNVLGQHEFRNNSATEMAFKEVVGGLVQNEQGVWVTKDGSTVEDSVNSFIANEDNAFLLKQKPNTGTGSTATKTTPADDGNKSLFKMSQAEVLQRAAEGKLPTQQNRV